jgi:hypothetical protein
MPLRLVSGGECMGGPGTSGVGVGVMSPRMSRKTVMSRKTATQSRRESDAYKSCWFVECGVAC